VGTRREVFGPAPMRCKMTAAFQRCSDLRRLREGIPKDRQEIVDFSFANLQASSTWPFHLQLTIFDLVVQETLVFSRFDVQIARTIRKI
jgi:hypothetical protein